MYELSKFIKTTIHFTINAPHQDNMKFKHLSFSLNDTIRRYFNFAAVRYKIKLGSTQV